MLIRLLACLLFAALLTPASALAQTLDHAAQRQVVSDLETALRQNYVFPDRIPAITAELDRRVQRQPVDGQKFAADLTLGLIKASDDLHFAVVLDPDEVVANRRAKTEG
ncbi:MAG: peptidase S41, partial [Brevundimonas sp.]